MPVLRGSDAYVAIKVFNRDVGVAPTNPTQPISCLCQAGY